LLFPDHVLSAQLVQFELLRLVSLKLLGHWDRVSRLLLDFNLLLVKGLELFGQFGVL
jgi:hypothetical protein